MVISKVSLMYEWGTRAYYRMTVVSVTVYFNADTKDDKVIAKFYQKSVKK